MILLHGTGLRCRPAHRGECAAAGAPQLGSTTGGRPGEEVDAGGLRRKVPGMDTEPPDTPALRALTELGIEHVVTRHRRVGSLAEAAAVRGVPPRAIVKTMVVRRGGGDHLFVLVPGDREISWPKLRSLLGVSRLSMPDADSARQVTGYERGTITPFGSATELPVVADERIVGQAISIGAGAHGVAATVAADDVIPTLGALVADVTDPASGKVGS